MFTNYPCTKGCKKVFWTEESRMKHEYFTRCSNVCFDHNIASPSQETTMRDINLFEPTSPSTSGLNDIIWDPTQVQYQEVVEEVEITTDYKQQPANMQHSYGVRNIQEIMNCPTPSSHQVHELDKAMQSKKTSKNNRCNELNIQLLFSDVVPETPSDNFSEECVQKTCTNKTLSELNSVPEDSLGSLMLFDDNIDKSEIEKLAIATPPDMISVMYDILNSTFSPPIQDSTISGSQKSEEEFMFSDGNIPLLGLNLLDMDEYGWSSSATSTDCQPVIEPLQMESYVKDNDNPGFVETTASVVSQEPRKRGRPRKNQTKTDIKSQNIKLEDSQFNSYANDTILPDRRCKMTSLQKIRNSISDGSESGSSDQEYLLADAEGSRKRVRRVPSRYEQQDSDYDDPADSADTLSHISLSDTLTEDEHQTKRKKNNEASKKSRIKRKEQDQKMEVECQQLQERYVYLNVRAERLQKAVEKIMKYLAVKNGDNVEAVQVF